MVNLFYLMRKNAIVLLLATIALLTYSCKKGLPENT